MGTLECIGLISVVVAVVCKVLNKLLIIHYINKFDPSIMDEDLESGPLPDGEYRWEKTAGLDIVPKWVSAIGLLYCPVQVVAKYSNWTLTIGGLLYLIGCIF